MLKRRFWIVRALVIATCAALAGRAAARLVTSAYLAPVGETRARAIEVPPAPPREKPAPLARDLFCSGCGARPPVSPRGPAARSALPVELVSTMYCGRDERWSMAVIRDLSTKEKDAHLYSRGMRLHGATVIRVLDRRVYLRRGDYYEYLEFAESGIAPPLPKTAEQGVACGAGGCQIERALVDKLLADPTSLARVAPAPGGGFRLFAIAPNSILAQLGLQNGDIVKAINGTELSSPEIVFDLYIKLRHATRLSVAVERRGARSTLDYAITGQSGGQSVVR